MSRYQLKKRLARVGDQVDDFIDDAGDKYDSLRYSARRRAKELRHRAHEVRDRAEDAWDHRDDLLEDFADGAISLGECAVNMLSRKFKSDPVGTVAIAAISLWVLGRLAKR